MAQDARKFKYSSDYPQPIVVYRGEHTITVSANEGMRMRTISHNLPFVPLALGKWSDTQDFNKSYDMVSFQQVSQTVAQLYSDSNYFYIFTSSNESSSKTFYFRFIAFAPPDYNGDISSVSNNSDYRFNSDYDYLGVYKQGVLDHSTGGAVSHDLGYIPQCRAWSKTDVSWPGSEYNGIYHVLEPLIMRYISSNRLEYDSIATQNKFIAYGEDMRYDTYPLSEYAKIYYHIYTEEA